MTSSEPAGRKELVDTSVFSPGRAFDSKPLATMLPASLLLVLPLGTVVVVEQADPPIRSNRRTLILLPLFAALSTAFDHGPGVQRELSFGVVSIASPVPPGSLPAIFDSSARKN